jgi:hypothetical protein
MLAMTEEIKHTDEERRAIARFGSPPHPPIPHSITLPSGQHVKTRPVAGSPKYDPEFETLTEYNTRYQKEVIEIISKFGDLAERVELLQTVERDALKAKAATHRPVTRRDLKAAKEATTGMQLYKMMYDIPEEIQAQFWLAATPEVQAEYDELTNTIDAAVAAKEEEMQEKITDLEEEMETMVTEEEAEQRENDARGDSDDEID